MATGQARVKRIVSKTDPLSSEARSALMARVRGVGNKSTELRVESSLIEAGVTKWVKHPKHVQGRPDFYFPDQRMALFVDGCFWHACPQCARRTPGTRSTFWQNKIDGNRRRDNRIRRKLRAEGFHVARVWEHDLRSGTWLKRVQSMLRRIDRTEKKE